MEISKVKRILTIVGSVGVIANIVLCALKIGSREFSLISLIKATFTGAYTYHNPILNNALVSIKGFGFPILMWISIVLIGISLFIRGTDNEN